MPDYCKCKLPGSCGKGLPPKNLIGGKLTASMRARKKNEQNKLNGPKLVSLATILSKII